MGQDRLLPECDAVQPGRRRGFRNPEVFSRQLHHTDKFVFMNAITVGTFTGLLILKLFGR